MGTIDPLEFRQALGSFATGVTVITSIDQGNNPVGVTASSFNSVSLDPPLVLWSLAKNAMSLSSFQNAGYFCVHILAASQQDTSNQFASRGADKFAGIDWRRGIGNLPILSKYAARFQCKTSYQYEGGDHIIFVGEVLECDRVEELPLVFHGGKYALAKTKNSNEKPGEAVNIAAGTFSDQFFLYLLSRSHFQAAHKLQKDLCKSNLNKEEYLALTLFGMGGSLSFQDLHDRMEHTGYSPSHGMLQDMLERGLIVETMKGTLDEIKLSLSVKGRKLYVSLLAKSKAIEEELLDGFSPEEVADTRDFLKRFIQKTDPGIPDLWQ
ncbi:flavin reductase [Microbulbifer sp. 2205BS26-8]|uniref:flavin reductase n=1 Tax=Microbulbifer sp. 2205BS26-8 TaxID=3064386 RepID=UPI00273E8F9A|nr:flavin reductase [Microbulbifer sp. 2205BS26-8]MDP5209251.1 flavin reductase [Microbulbifer sp. 2205BS26-8]